MKIDDDPSQEKATYVTSGKGFMPIIRYFSALNQKELNQAGLTQHSKILWLITPFTRLKVL